MRRYLSKAHLGSITDSFCRFKAPENGRKKAAERMEYSQSFASSRGHSCFGFEGESISRSAQVQIVNALQLSERGRASTLLSDLVHGNHSLRADDFIHILNYCAKSPDPLFVMETWRTMEEKEISMNKRCYMLIIRALCKGGYLEEAFNWLTSLGENHRMYHILSLYNSFLNGCAQMQSTVHANYCLDLMENRLTGKSKVTYWELLKLAVWRQDLSTVHDIWKECTKYYNPGIITLRKFIWSFTKLKDLVSAHEALQYMVALAFRASFCIHKSAEGRYRYSRVDIPIPSKGELGISRFAMGKHGDTVPSSLFENCKVRIGEEDVGGYHMDIISGENQALYGIDKNLDRFSVEGDNCCRRIPLFHVANQEQCTVSGMGSTEFESGGFSMLKRHEAMPVMKLLRWSFTDVMHACAQSRNCELAEQLFLQMHNLGLEPSSHTYNAFIKAVVHERGVTDGMKVLKTMQKKNLKPYDATLATLSVCCSKNLELDLAEALLDQIVGSPHLRPYNALLAACSATDQPERAVRVLAKMKQLKLKSDIRTYELLFSLFGNVNAPYEKGNILSQVDAAKRINAIETDMVKNDVQHSHLSLENLLKALGAEGMIRELIHYLHVAENQFFRTNTYRATSIYNTVLHSLVEAKESHMVIDIFKDMKLCDLPPDAVTYNIMINCCSIIRCYKSACALVSMMLRDGFCPRISTYTALIKILLANEDFDEAFNILDQASSEGIEFDVLLFNTILQEANLKGRIDIIELIVERMHQDKIQPDPSTCCSVFSAYVNDGFLSTAMEALQVLSMRMISSEEGTLQEMRTYFEDFVLAEDLEAESLITEVFRDPEDNLAAALLNLRWCAVLGLSISWLPNESPWARRLSSIYSTRNRTT
ncbi:hypothetical protein HHK36_002849 [Tetracentron sinense]|uniref:PROP1-like PPR domain-containing protein n=1 Tax=Tetracentron sinense TaxID=13715 RepID=A0A834ZQ65_TETSI|nr:hypothetical protein HHK36_002849 [Tetracentron sinense]